MRSAEEQRAIREDVFRWLDNKLATGAYELTRTELENYAFGDERIPLLDQSLHRTNGICEADVNGVEHGDALPVSAPGSGVHVQARRALYGAAGLTKQFFEAGENLMLAPDQRHADSEE